MIVICPECKCQFSHKGIKRHLVKSHGYRYTDESPNEPQPPKQGKE